MASGLGVVFAAAVAVGVFGGMAIDRACGWRPIVCTILFGIVGGAAGFRIVLTTLAALERSRPPAAPPKVGSPPDERSG